ncbi:hypothetical protein VP01_2958g1 [Puccinia sorghi]|uniref:Uncharacterized protein n=1 Tax=Puccinia sorghi TaxID=27349 RepID=A0A0L6V0T9_9BASI|nr:hypothetical protein VP01_2958g1 [Puccinia sorghi]
MLTFSSPWRFNRRHCYIPQGGGFCVSCGKALLLMVQHHLRVCWAFEPNSPKNLSHNDQLDDWEDNVSEDNETSSKFQDSALLHIQKALPSIIVPCGVTRIPLDLGDPKHGKLKASEWHVLFSTYLPLSLIDFFFAEAYLLYTDTSTVIFPLRKVLPNHQYALHLPEQLRWWGPLSNVSEFSGKRVNGILHKMKTNGKLGTVLREFCQNQRFHSQTANLLLQIVKRMVVYAVMLQKLQSEDLTLRHYQDVPHPNGSSVVTRKSKQNWLVMYCKDHDSRYGWVTHIYSLPDFGGRILVAIKSLCDACMGDKIDIHESFLQTLSDLELKIVEEETLYELLDPSEVFAVCAYRYLPPSTFKYHLPLIVLRPIPHDLSPLLYPTSVV